MKTSDFDSMRNVNWEPSLKKYRLIMHVYANAGENSFDAMSELLLRGSRSKRVSWDEIVAIMPSFDRVLRMDQTFIGALLEMSDTGDEKIVAMNTRNKWEKL